MLTEMVPILSEETACMVTNDLFIADTLQRCKVPYFGRLASSFVDEE